MCPPFRLGNAGGELLTRRSPLLASVTLSNLEPTDLIFAQLPRALQSLHLRVAEYMYDFKKSCTQSRVVGAAVDRLQYNTPPDPAVMRPKLSSASSVDNCDLHVSAGPAAWGALQTFAAVVSWLFPCVVKLPSSREATPEALSEEEAQQFPEERRKQAAEEIEWGILRAKIDALIPTRCPGSSSITPADLERILGAQLSQSSPTSIPASTLSAAPHLAQLSAGVNADPHLEQTWKFRRAFGSDKALDPIVDVMQLQALVDPLPRSIWRCIIQDQYVDFEKVFAALGPGLIHTIGQG
ncbi:hypothetical protein B0H13DRAFT_1887609 [Mycena leptocephala]|nr:hypothetical protein B0H13DRAFT_1887609 [Mycena leptocephala]